MHFSAFKKRHLMFERIKIKQLNEHIHLLDDNGEATGYLVTGKEKAAVIDTMNGIEDVHKAVRTITDLPLVLINTHGHCDHIFGNIYFDQAYMNPLDLPLAMEQIKHKEFVEICRKTGLSMPPFKPVADKDVFDLGGLTLEVIALPGHTHGGICLLLKQDRVLFTGDSINHHLWMQLDECLPISGFYENMKKIAFVKDKADFILHGHAQSFDSITLYDELLLGVKDLLESGGKDDEVFDYEYKWFKGKCKHHPFGTGESVICYKTVR